MKKKIQIQAINVPGQNNSMVMEMNQTNVFYLKAQKFVAGNQSNQVCIFFQIKKLNKVVLGEVVGAVNAGEGQIYKATQQILEQSQNKDLKSEILKLQNTLRIEKNNFNNQIKEYQEEIQELQKEQQSLKGQFDNKVEQEELQRAEIIQKYKVMMTANINLKNELLQKENLYEELISTKIKQKKKMKEDKNQYKGIIFIFNNSDKKFKRLQQEQQFERKKDKQVISQFQKQIQKYKINYNLIQK
ncbi:unnamed protein product [Paramecium sonneborni]|uniref:Uncharacterized protein n=1 Tax=Paramecium sonneborni TaxID=65129 RepID=A0A8S1PBM0_9CILI|nr:unnamed protein product [Paramecium sonneborni]